VPRPLERRLTERARVVDLDAVEVVLGPEIPVRCVRRHAREPLLRHGCCGLGAALVTNVLDEVDRPRNLKTGRGLRHAERHLDEARIIDHGDMTFPRIEVDEIGPPRLRMQRPSGDPRDRCVGVELAQKPSGVDATRGERGRSVRAHGDFEARAAGNGRRAHDILESGALQVLEHYCLLVPVRVDLLAPLLDEHSRVALSRIERPPAEVTFHASPPFLCERVAT
jgi:hypothetical protein